MGHFSFFKNSFFKAVLTVSMGTAIAQLIGIVTAPLISRLYTPADIGLLSNFSAIASIVAVFAAGCYEHAIVLPENKKETNAVLYTSFVISIIFSLIFTVLSILLRNQFIKIFHLEKLPEFWLYTIGAYIFLICFDASLTKFAIKNAHYKLLARTQVTQQIGSCTIKTGYGYFIGGVQGLFIGTFFTQVLRNLQLLFSERVYFLEKDDRPLPRDIASAIKRYKKFPLVTSWSLLFNTVSVQLPVIMITALFSITTSGSYSMANQILNLPLSLIGASVGNVFLQKASTLRFDISELRNLTNSVYKKLLLIGALCMSTVFFYGDWLFPFVLGEKWQLSGLFAQRISFWLLFVLATSPLTQIYIVLERQGEGLIVNLILFISRVLSIYICYRFHTNDVIMMTVFGCVSAVLWFLNCGRIMQILKLPIYQFLFETFYILLPIYGLQWLVFIIIKSFLF